MCLPIRAGAFDKLLRYVEGSDCELMAAAMPEVGVGRMMGPRKGGDAMARGQRRKCKCCLKLFCPDPRNSGINVAHCYKIPSSAPRTGCYAWARTFSPTAGLGVAGNNLSPPGD